MVAWLDWIVFLSSNQFLALETSNTNLMKNLLVSLLGKQKKKNCLTNNNKITNTTIKLVAGLNFYILSCFMDSCPQSHGPLSAAFPQSSL